MGTDTAMGALLSSLIKTKSDAVHLLTTLPPLALSTQPRTTFVMSNILELNCWVLGDVPRRVFPVKIGSAETVGYLKKAIKDEKKPLFDDITADSLDLWKVS